MPKLAGIARLKKHSVKSALKKVASKVRNQLPILKNSRTASAKTNAEISRESLRGGGSKGSDSAGRARASEFYNWRNSFTALFRRGAESRSSVLFIGFTLGLLYLFARIFGLSQQTEGASLGYSDPKAKDPNDFLASSSTFSNTTNSSGTFPPPSQVLQTPPQQPSPPLRPPLSQSHDGQVDTDYASESADDPVLWWKFDDDSSTDAVQGVPLTLHNDAFVAKGALHFPTSTTNRPYAIASNLTVAVTGESGEHTLATWISLASLEVPGGACPMAVQNSVSGHFDGFVWQERVHHQWMAGSENYRRSGPADNGGNAESVVGYPVHMVITYGARGVCIYRNGVAYCPCYDVPFFWQDATSMGSEVLFGTRGIHNGQTFGTFTGSVEEAAVYDYELSPRQVGELYKEGTSELAPAARHTSFLLLTS
ncbi:hypothetical protein CYMTET_38907 [Cymbomonas tetramitiformis]|uniref:Uncharacterized protein n=1 Tax=Cymbomonas tetramitiformis TaxID=36881 RepID=A0AAE0CCU5_9CHLO|nr:hypothetical protein CYMTET_38907 [Cymbomonas tetramitiformis]